MDDTRSWDDALAAQEEEKRNRQMADMANYNRAQMDQYGQMLGAQRAQAAQQRSNGFLQSAIAMRFARQNGGTIPVGMLDALNRNLGFDGKTKRLVGGAFEKDGNFTFFMQNGDGQGNFVDAPIRLDRRGQFALMRSVPGVFDANEIDSMGQELMVKDGYTREEIYGRGPLPGSRTETGGVVVPKSWMGTPERRGGAVFGSDGRGGFSNTRIDADGNVTREDYGTRDANYKGNWKVLSSGSHAQGRGTRYENDKTGEVIFVPEGQTIESVTRGVSDKERIAEMNNETKRKALDIQQQNAEERSAHNQAVEGQQAENEKGRNERARQAAELKSNLAELKSKGTIGGRQPTTHEYVELMRFANDPANSEGDRNQARALGDIIKGALEKRGEKVPEVKSGVGNDASGANKTYKEGDEQEINGVRMKLLPSKKNPGKLTWQRI